MALIDEAKTALRVSTTDAGITAQIERLIEEAKLDLCRTADIAEENVMVSEPDALIKGAILCYVGYAWTTDADEKDRLKSCYDDYKGKLSMSSAYGTYSGE
ncbi:MAG: hypothetical protein J6S41_06665 [Clostridia bacterium]|nr:hypothetical protein [Clostridia bacterium]